MNKSFDRMAKNDNRRTKKNMRERERERVTRVVCDVYQAEFCMYVIIPGSLSSLSTGPEMELPKTAEDICKELQVFR